MRKRNMVLNGEWGRHVRPYIKRYTAKLRRAEGRREVARQVKDHKEVK